MIHVKKEKNKIFFDSRQIVQKRDQNKNITVDLISFTAKTNYISVKNKKESNFYTAKPLLRSHRISQEWRTR